ncbi:EF-hand domain-containing protein [Defluviimonas sp. WL0024]|uniref:EF-hand domain-containing protein n=2 Tax=Albidovulum TaxID=205889 RepID=A0ABT3J0J9_9RHOB|nr:MULTISPECIES: EF-hand domain-containing protein [Defluviimonas]MCU9846945.1 EF-hand domain-containing protein [Defluviimonas sp. WL0024]MCW3781203.1 EF-hand domain-containing protein [Defluviimonas salinarum]
MKKFVLALGAIAAFAAAANAQTTVTDTDGSGAYSIEELTAAYPDLTAEVFATIDVNADGVVDADELAAAREAGTLAP